MIRITSQTIGPGVIWFAEARPKVKAPLLLAPHVRTSEPGELRGTRDWIYIMIIHVFYTLDLYTVWALYVHYNTCVYIYI